MWRDLRVLNRRIYERYRRRSLADVLADFRRSHQQVLRAVHAMPDRDIVTRGRYAWTRGTTLEGYIAANTSSHYRWAKNIIRAWMKTQGRL
jgi:hypothetical protein